MKLIFSKIFFVSLSIFSWAYLVLVVPTWALNKKESEKVSQNESEKDYVYDCDQGAESSTRVLSVPQHLYLDVFWKLFNDLRDLDQTRESVGVTPEQSQCIGEMRAVLERLYAAAPASAKNDSKFFIRMGQYQNFIVRYPEAESSFRQALRVSPKSILANVELARVLKQRKNQIEQEKYLREAIKHFPETEEDKVLLAESYQKLVENFETDANKAVTLIEEWLRWEPKSLNARTAQADVGLELKRSELVDAAIPFLLSPDKEYYLAHSAYQKKNYSSATTYFRAYLKHASRDMSEDLSNTIYLIRSIVGAQKYPEARKECELALSRFSNNADLVKLHEEIVLDLGGLDREKMPRDLELAAEKNPNSRRLQIRVIEELLKDLSLDLTDADPNILKSAVAYADQMLNSNSDDLEALYWKAFVRYHSRAFAEADVMMLRVLSGVKDKKMAQSLLQPHTQIYELAARIKNALGYTNEAKEFLGKTQSSTVVPVEKEEKKNSEKSR